MVSTSPPLFRFKDGESKSDSENGVYTPEEIRILSVTELGNVTSWNTYVKRDLGFQGRIGGHVLLTYGNTMFSDADLSDKWRGMTCNSVAIASQNPTTVLDALLDENTFPRSLLKPSSDYGEDPSTYSLGLTNVVEISPSQGVFDRSRYENF